MEPVQVHEERVVTPRTASSTTTVASPGYRIGALVWLIAGILDVILAFDFLFRALKANTVGFADFIYSLGGPLASPFDGIFGVTVTNTTYVVRWADLLAIAVYSLVALAIVKVMLIASTPRTTTVV